MVLQRLLRACFTISRQDGDTQLKMSQSLPGEPHRTDNAASTQVLLPVHDVRPPASNIVAKEFFKNIDQQQASRCRVDPGYIYSLRSERGPLSSRALVGGVEYDLFFVNPLAEGPHEGGVPIVYAGAALPATSMGELGKGLNNPLAAEYSYCSSCELDSPREVELCTVPQCGTVPYSYVLDGHSNDSSPVSPRTPLQGINFENAFVPACRERPSSPKLGLNAALCYVPASKQVRGSSPESKCGRRLGSGGVTSVQEQCPTDTVTDTKSSGTRTALDYEEKESCSSAGVQDGPLATPKEPFILPPQTPIDNEPNRRHLSIDSLPEQQGLDMAEDHLVDGGDIAAAVLNSAAAPDVFAPCTPPLAVRDGCSLSEPSTVSVIMPPSSSESLKTPGEPGYRLTGGSCGEGDGQQIDMLKLRSAASEPPLVSPPQLFSDIAREGGACCYSTFLPQSLVAETALEKSRECKSPLAGDASLQLPLCAETVQQGNAVTGMRTWTAEERIAPVASATQGADSVQSLLKLHACREGQQQHQIGIQLIQESGSAIQEPSFKEAASEAEAVAAFMSSQDEAQPSYSLAHGSIQRQPNNPRALSRSLFSLPAYLASQDGIQQLPAPLAVSSPALVTVQMAVEEGQCAAGPERAVMHVDSVLEIFQHAKSSPLDYELCASVGLSNGVGRAAATIAAATSLVSLPSPFLPAAPPAPIRPHLIPRLSENSEGNSADNPSGSADCNKVGLRAATPTLPVTQGSEESSQRVPLSDPGCSISSLAMTRLLIRQMGLLPEAPLATGERSVTRPSGQDAAAADGELAASPFATAMNTVSGALHSALPAATAVTLSPIERLHSLVDNQRGDREATSVTSCARRALQTSSTTVLIAKDDPSAQFDGSAPELVDDVDQWGPEAPYSSYSSTRESSMLFGEEISSSLYGVLNASSMQSWLEPQLWKPLREKFGGVRQVAEAQMVAA